MDAADQHFEELAQMETGYFGTCDWGHCDRPANAVRRDDSGLLLAVCDNHSMPGEVAIATLEALQNLYDDWPGPDTEPLQAARAILQAAKDSTGQPT